MSHKTCMHCGSSALRRINRHGFLEESVLPKLGLFPWECAMCRRKTFLRDNGHDEIRRRHGNRTALDLAQAPDTPQDESPIDESRISGTRIHGHPSTGD